MKFFTCCVSILIFSFNVFAKNATVHITVKNFKGSISVEDPTLRYNLTKAKSTILQLDKNHSASYTIEIARPTYLLIRFSSGKLFSYNFFLSPGDELFLTTDFTKKNNGVTVTGRGANNNQPEIFALTDMNTKSFNGDATPYRLIAALHKQFLLNKVILTNYIKLNKPSAMFIKTAKINLDYFVPLKFYKSYHHNFFGKPKAQQLKWQKIQDSLFSTVKLSNDTALISCNYIQLIEDFVTHETDNLWDEYRNNPALFFKKWLHTSLVHGNKIFSYAQLGTLNKLVIDHYFNGKAAEYAYCQAIKFEFKFKSDYQSSALLYNYFKKKYPASLYIKGFDATIQKVAKKQRQTISGKTIFISGNGSKLNTLNEVIALNKGKTVFIDMWGTWCGPCKQEIEKNAKQLRAHFAGKNVTFLYIANSDLKRKQEWKKQIAYFQMQGEHILANSRLTDDIMKKVKASGYPTYVIIKKDGSFKQALTRYPVNLPAMIKEIEIATL